MRFRPFPCLAALLLFLSPAATGWSRTVTCAADITKASAMMETNVAYNVTAVVTCILRNAALGIADESGSAVLTDFHSGRFDHAYIRIRGVVRDVFLDEIDPSWIYIVIGSGRGSVSTALNISQTDRSDLTDIGDFRGLSPVP